MSAERLPGIDYCAHAPTSAETGQLPAWETIRHCPVCLRRWRIGEARLHGWVPLPRGEALRLLDQMATEAASGRDPRTEAAHRGFYAHLARHPEDEASFAAACAVAFAPAPPAETIPPPQDFGWRAIFADLPPAPPAPTGPITRVWQWRGSGEAFAQEVRTFVRGELPPAFVAAQGGVYRGQHTIREGSAGARPILQQQLLGPLLLTLTEADSPDELALALRLHQPAVANPVRVRLYQSHGEAAAPGEVTWQATLSSPGHEETVVLGRAAFASFQVEADTDW